MPMSFRSNARFRNWACFVMLAVASSWALGGCYGAFPLTKAVYRLNGDAGGDGRGGQVVQTVVMWILVIIPVYSVATFADAVVLNLIEFWTGDTLEMSSSEERDGVTVALEPEAGGRKAVLTVRRDGEPLTEQHVVKIDENVFEMRDASGVVTGKVFRKATGDIALADAEGHVVRTISAGDLAFARVGD